MKKIPLTHGKFAIIDDEDFQRVNQYKWRIAWNNYARAWINKKDIFLHKFVLNDFQGIIDHKNGNPLDNRKTNLRKATLTQNNANSKKHKDNTSGYKGVSWSKVAGKWRSQIQAYKKLYCLGYFVDKVEAANAYNKAAIKYFGEFSRLNKI